MTFNPGDRVRVKSGGVAHGQVGMVYAVDADLVGDWVTIRLDSEVGGRTFNADDIELVGVRVSDRAVVVCREDATPAHASSEPSGGADWSKRLARMGRDQLLALANKLRDERDHARRVALETLGVMASDLSDDNLAATWVQRPRENVAVVQLRAEVEQLCSGSDVARKHLAALVQALDRLDDLDGTVDVIDAIDVARANASAYLRSSEG